MSAAYIHLTDIMVDKGWEGQPQDKFPANRQNPEQRGNLFFKVSNRIPQKDSDPKYDRYTVEYRVMPTSKQIEMLNQPGVRVNLRGRPSIEVFESKKFVKVFADYVEVTRFGEGGQQKQAAPAAKEEKQLNF
jgi:hypothetical protein